MVQVILVVFSLTVCLRPASTSIAHGVFSPGTAVQVLVFSIMSGVLTAFVRKSMELLRTVGFKLLPRPIIN